MLPRAILAVACVLACHAQNRPLTCASCHPKEASSQVLTGMSRTLDTGQQAEILKSHSNLTFQQKGFDYAIERKGDQSLYHVTHGQEAVAIPIAWAFGLGAAGQTYLLNRNGVWYESRVSFYKDTRNLDLTVGARPDAPRNMEEAIGRELTTKGAEECFHCHSTNALVKGKLHIESLTPGIQCQRCHENTDEHSASFGSSGAPKVTPRHLGALSTEEVSDFCGQCHRTWAQIASQGPHNISNVRFQPYRLANSKCYDATDARIRCTTCHNPHADAVQPLGNYDNRCRACHAGGADAKAKLCKVGKTGCASCHMPKIEIREAHNKFTDHWIRIVRPGEAVPN